MTETPAQAPQPLCHPKWRNVTHCPNHPKRPITHRGATGFPCCAECAAEIDRMRTIHGDPRRCTPIVAQASADVQVCTYGGDCGEPATHMSPWEQPVCDRHTAVWNAIRAGVNKSLCTPIAPAVPQEPQEGWARDLWDNHEIYGEMRHLFRAGKTACGKIAKPDGKPCPLDDFGTCCAACVLTIVTAPPAPEPLNCDIAAATVLIGAIRDSASLIPSDRALFLIDALKAKGLIIVEVQP